VCPESPVATEPNQLLVGSPPLLTDEQAASLLAVSPATLRSWRCRGIGPTFIKMGNGAKAPVRYAGSDLEQYITQCRQVPSVRAAFEG
jgi:hypothetical protein